MKAGPIPMNIQRTKETTARRFGARGEGRIAFIFALIILVAAVFVAARLIPVKVKAYQFADYMRDEAQRTAWTKDDETLKKHLLEKARMLDLPITEENLKVIIGGGEIVVSARYEIPVDLGVKTYVWHFDQQERAPLF